MKGLTDMSDSERIYETKDIQGMCYIRYGDSPYRQYIATVSDELGLHTRESVGQKRRWTEDQAKLLIITIGLKQAITWSTEDVLHVINTGTLPEDLQEAITELSRQDAVKTGLVTPSHHAAEADAA